LVLAVTDSFEAVPGFGVSATVEGREVHVGADRYMERLGHAPANSPPRRLASAMKGKARFTLPSMAASRRSSPSPIRSSHRRRRRSRRYARSA